MVVECVCVCGCGGEGMRKGEGVGGVNILCYPLLEFIESIGFHG